MKKKLNNYKKQIGRILMINSSIFNKKKLSEYFLRMRKGFTLFEILVAMAVFSVVVVGATWVAIYGFRYNSVVWSQLQAQNDGRRALQEMVSVLRKAEESSLGSYPLVTVEDNQIVFYANVDADNYKEKIKFYLEDSILKKSVVKPNGDPLSYGGEETISEIAKNIINESSGQALFEYYGSDYLGVGIPLVQPVSATEVTYVRMNIQIDEDTVTTPSALQMEGGVQIRNLKQD
jgi:prepilin-type N-terminal cleavage/methylation domain-containing protein